MNESEEVLPLLVSERSYEMVPIARPHSSEPNVMVVICDVYATEEEKTAQENADLIRDLLNGHKKSVDSYNAAIDVIRRIRVAMDQSRGKMGVKITKAIMDVLNSTEIGKP